MMGDSPTEHEDVVEQGLLGQGDHLLQAQLLAAPVEAIRAVHADMSIIAARAILHGAQSRRALVGGSKMGSPRGRKSGPRGEVFGRAPALLSTGNRSLSDARGLQDRWCNTTHTCSYCSCLLCPRGVQPLWWEPP